MGTARPSIDPTRKTEINLAAGFPDRKKKKEKPPKPKQRHILLPRGKSSSWCTRGKERDCPVPVCPIFTVTAMGNAKKLSRP